MVKKSHLVLTILAYVFLVIGIVGVLFLTVFSENETLDLIGGPLGGGLFIFVLLGSIAHIMMLKSDEGYNKALFVFSLIPFLVVMLFWLIIKLIKWIINTAKGGKTVEEGGGADVCYINDEHGFERTLTFYDYGEIIDHEFYKTHSVNEGKYKRYRDDLGDFWRTYDGSHFVRERYGQLSGEY